MLEPVLELLVNIIGGENYINFFIALISAIAAGIIAFATWRYTNYSKKNYEELKKQNKFLIKKDFENYVFSVKQESIDLLIEARSNGCMLFDATKRLDKDLDFLKTHDSKALIDNILSNPIEYGSTTFLESFLENSSFKSLTEKNVKYKNPDILIKIKKIYEHTNMIAMNLSYIYKEKKNLEYYLKKYKQMIYDVLVDIKELYKLFKKEGIIDFENSEYY